MNKHLERAEKWMFERDDVDDLTSLAALLAEVENEALERAATRLEQLATVKAQLNTTRSIVNGALYSAAIEIRDLKEPK